MYALWKDLNELIKINLWIHFRCNCDPTLVVFFLLLFADQFTLYYVLSFLFLKKYNVFLLWPIWFSCLLFFSFFLIIIIYFIFFNYKPSFVVFGVTSPEYIYIKKTLLLCVIKKHVFFCHLLLSHSWFIHIPTAKFFLPQNKSLLIKPLCLTTT